MSLTAASFKTVGALFMPRSSTLSRRFIRSASRSTPSGWPIMPFAGGAESVDVATWRAPMTRRRLLVGGEAPVATSFREYLALGGRYEIEAAEYCDDALTRR
jgi:hypothetical protein